MLIVSSQSSFSKEMWVNEVLPFVATITNNSYVKVNASECLIIDYDVLIVRDGWFEYRIDDNKHNMLEIFMCLAHKFSDNFKVEATSDYEPEDEMKVLQEARSALERFSIEPNYTIKGIFKAYPSLNLLVDIEDNDIIIF